MQGNNFSPNQIFLRPDHFKLKQKTLEVHAVLQACYCTPHLMAGWHNIIEHNKQIHTNSKTYHKLPRCGTSESKHNLTRASTARTALNCSSCSSVPAKSQELTRTTSSEDVVPWGRRTKAAKKEIDDTDDFFCQRISASLTQDGYCIDTAEIAPIFGSNV